MVLNFFDKEKYVPYYENLKAYLRLELKLKKSCVSEFYQSQWLKPYVKSNTQQRIEAEKRWHRWRSIAQINKKCCVW